MKKGVAKFEKDAYLAPHSTAGMMRQNRVLKFVRVSLE